MKTPLNQRQSQIASLRHDPRTVAEIKRQLDGEIPLFRATTNGVSRDRIAAVIGEAAPRPGGSDALAEAIVLLTNRPSLLVQNDTFTLPESGDWRSRLLPRKSSVEKAIRSTGRVELSNNPDYDWVGTGWVIAPGVVVTNRHVALTFGVKSGAGFAFLRGPNTQSMAARLDFKEEYRTGTTAEFEIQKILFIEDLGGQNPDLALLQFKQASGLPSALNVYRGVLASGRDVAVIGYPARDSRNADDAMSRVFGDIFNVKRLAPGTISGADKKDWFFTHDCSTLGGNSGSLVQDLETGEAIGLHYGGRFRQANYAVRADVLLDRLAKAKVKITVPAKEAKKKPAKATKEATTPATKLATRPGYQENFLGQGFNVSLPGLKSHAGDAVVVKKTETGVKKHRLDYTHFSVVMSVSRKLCRYTAVNIDGTRLLRIPREGDKWFFDGRIGADVQTGNPLYANNDYDRGHMVRRLDPVWGPNAEASLANDDTFHYTNSCPQHAQLNQKIWNDLEDYLLDNAGAHDLRISVFTGPVLREDDHDYRGVLIPRDFWKVVVMVNAAKNKLHATAYTLTQSHLVGNITEGFVFGQFATAQLPVADLAQLVGLDFHGLEQFDPLARSGGEELTTGQRRNPLSSVRGIIL